MRFNKPDFVAISETFFLTTLLGYGISLAPGSPGKIDEIESVIKEQNLRVVIASWNLTPSQRQDAASSASLPGRSRGTNQPERVGICEVPQTILTLVSK